MATKLKIVHEPTATEAAPQTSPAFTPAPTRNRHAGWTAERQRAFIDRLALTGSVGEGCAIAGVASSSAYRLRNKAGAKGFARAWDAALALAATRLAAITFDRAINGRAERFYKDGELVMERRMPSDHLLTWLLARLDPLQFGTPTARARRGHRRPARRRPQFAAGIDRVVDRRRARRLRVRHRRSDRRPARRNPRRSGRNR